MLVRCDSFVIEIVLKFVEGLLSLLPNLLKIPKSKSNKKQKTALFYHLKI
jgi:hypothetical protein